MSVPVSRPTAARAVPVDPGRWPDVVRVPGSPVRAAVAERLVRRALTRLPLRVSLPDGVLAGTGGADAPLLRVQRPGAFFARIGESGLIGFGESYMAGEWDSEDLVGVLTVLASHVASLIPAPLQRLRSVWARRQPSAQRNTVVGARGNISRHYDVSNDLFSLFLDETMTYSAALFTPDGFSREGLSPDAGNEPLAAAQHRKIDRLLDLAAVGPGSRLLEIGTGWGELALRAAQRGATVVTVTLSQEQRALARLRIREAGCADRVTVLLQDYRQIRGEYDAVVSVEMIEAVGEEFWPVYFTALERLLAPGGRIALQAITMPHDRLLASRRTFTWIQKYIFPGGLLPSVTAIEQALARHTGLRIAEDTGFGPHYARTLEVWRERFTDRAREVAALGFDGTFRRMWTFYLAYSEAGFRSGYLDVRQLLLVPGAGGTR
ncbi:cyclopropane-fatty-acyl-phospholipid synthase family protein [Streptomyces sp. H10-C2]|uniref:SAM-dependent methyltransferase n=1 Tax=unclassified Streptomyces TaxID=2593676 RepID=UPI0024B94449|nr:MULTISPECIES: cyclopropane-fatty-acyl-phospholipid synthase family protein [unclassified Streptomyces]MDJ0342943.1 cyclopropane-fatty-acyl-phospholipid synthase family protein [Streptomyces sp. PH10-H1]MDJ0371495.1 cyclopropane-fatty-acyl-phospholipid synthase family protein [Streptomyces sp. H10-C2]